MQLPLFQPRLSPQEETNNPTRISMTYFDVRAWIMFMQGQKCLLSDVITSGNRELLFLSHSKQKIYEEDNKSALERLGRQGTFKFRALWSVTDGKGITRFRPRSPIATGNCLDRAEKIPKVNQTSGTVDVFDPRSGISGATVRRVSACPNLHE